MDQTAIYTEKLVPSGGGGAAPWTINWSCVFLDQNLKLSPNRALLNWCYPKVATSRWRLLLRPLLYNCTPNRDIKCQFLPHPHELWSTCDPRPTTPYDLSSTWPPSASPAPQNDIKGRFPSLFCSHRSDLFSEDMVKFFITRQFQPCLYNLFVTYVVETAM